MKIDVTLEITPKMVQDAQGHDKKSLSGHLGTHFDVMNKEFLLEYTQRRGIVFDVSGIKDRDIGVFDVDLEEIPRIHLSCFTQDSLRRKATEVQGISRRSAAV